MSFGLYDAEEAAIHQPKVIFLDEKNRVTKQH
jgi:aspartate 1-decarboxylase